jgi:hypothetical protein
MKRKPKPAPKAQSDQPRRVVIPSSRRKYWPPVKLKR